MKQMLMLIALVACTALDGLAWPVAIATNGTGTVKMIAPPAVVTAAGIAQVKPRIALESVAMGELRQSGGVVIIAANSGVTCTNEVHSGVTAVRALTIPETALTGADGTNAVNSVYWFRVHPTRTSLIVQPSTLISGATITYLDANGDTLTTAVANSITELRGFTGALYGYASTTGCVVNAFAIP